MFGDRTFLRVFVPDVIFVGAVASAVTYINTYTL